jgi:peptidoglycan/LPS O-acetylase OafA/YrhL
MTQPNQRYLVLDGMRGLAAMIIVIHHFTVLSGLRETFASAAIAVDFFFCLGGFVIAHAYHERLVAGMGVREYVGRRLKRLYPAFFVSIVVGAFALGLGKTLGATDLSWSAIEESTFLNALYVPFPNWSTLRLFDSKVVGAIFPGNGPAWSLFFALFANSIYALVIRRAAWGPPVVFSLRCLIKKKHPPTT